MIQTFGPSTVSLYRHYPWMDRPQAVYIYLDIPAATMAAYYDPEDDGAMEEDEVRGVRRRYEIPALTRAAAIQAMSEIEPLAERVVAGATIERYGKTRWATLDADAQEAEEEILNQLDREWSEADLVAVYDPPEMTDAEIKSRGVTADTTDEELDEIAEGILRELAEDSPSGEAAVDGLLAVLTEARDGLVEEE